MKKTIGIISLSVLLFSTITPSFTYGIDVTINGEEYISSDGCYTFKQSTTTEGLAITDYNDECSKEIEIPSTVTDEDNNEFTVTEIGLEAFKDKNLTSIIIPDTIEKISCAGFLNNPNIETLKISRDYNVGGCAEFMQSKIKNLIISGDSIEKITGSFRELGIENLTLPNGLKEIGENAFINNNIGNVILPDTIETIGRRAFQNNNISSIEFPESTKTIGAQSFENNNISNVSISGNIGILGGSAFNGNPLDGTFKIFGSVETVGGGGHSNTKNLTLDIGLETIPNSFYGTYFGVGPIKSLIIDEPVREIDNYAFGSNGLYTENIEIKEGVEKIGKNAFAYLQYSGTLTLPKSIKEIDDFAFNSAKIKELVIEEGSQLEKIGEDAFNGADLEKVEIHSEYENGAELGGSSFQNNNGGKIKTVILDGISIIGNQAFAMQGIESITLTEGLTEIGTAAFYDNNLDRIFLPKTINSIGNGAFCKSNTTQKVDAIVRTDINNTGMFQKACLNPIRGFIIKFINGENLVDEKLHISGESIDIPILTGNIGYEFAGWAENGTDDIININSYIVNEDKELHPVWKTLEEKAQESATGNVVYTNETTVTIGDNIQEEPINNSSTINLVSKEVGTEDVKTEEEKITVKESEIQVTSDKTVEYQGGLEVYLEKTTNIGEEETKERIEGTAKFSSPVAVKIPITSKAETVKVQVKHEGEDFGYRGLTTNPVNNCIDGESENDRYNGGNINVKETNGEKYALIYTCSASTFVAYTENTKQSNNTTNVSTPAAGGGRVITTNQEQKATVQEHNSANIENSEFKETTIQTNQAVQVTQKAEPLTIQEKAKIIEGRSLTRGEVAIMTNILLDVYPQLTENRELNEVSEACESYADEQNFTKDEKKAITRLCKLSIMGIHADDNKPLDEFMVNEITKNDEFSKVINRSLSTYTEKDFSTVKDALKKLEGDEENVVFGTVYNVFMSIKNIFN